MEEWAPSPLTALLQGMPYADHLLGYRLESTEDLLAEKEKLKEQRSVFVQQGMGSKTLQRDLRMLEERLQAINYVLAERGYSGPVPPTKPNACVGIVDFSMVKL